MEQDRKAPKKQTCTYMQQPMIMNWQCCCCPCMIQQPTPYQGGNHTRVEGENKYENKNADEDEDNDVRVWKRPIKEYHKWNGSPMYGPGWYHYHWNGHNWNGPWHDKKPYNNGWHDYNNREEEV